jgi:hypothetical protein
MGTRRTQVGAALETHNVPLRLSASTLAETVPDCDI